MHVFDSLPVLSPAVKHAPRKRVQLKASSASHRMIAINASLRLSGYQRYSFNQLIYRKLIIK